MAVVPHDRGKRAYAWADGMTRPDPKAGPILFAMTHSLPGGLREIWNDVAEGLAERGYQTGRFVFYPASDDPVTGTDSASWHHIVARRRRSIFAAMGLFFALVRYLRAVRPVAIVTAMPAANVLIPLAVLCARLPTRVFISHHSPTDTHNHLLDRLDGWTGSLACVEAVVSVSDAVAASLDAKPARYRRKRRTIHNALPERIERLIDTLRRPAEARVTGSGRRIVALGRLTDQKNYPMLLRAMALLPDATLDIVGAGEDGPALGTLVAELGIADRVQFVGLLSRQQALALAATADIFVQVSRYEGHSLALIEAARLGLPLVVSDVSVQVEAITLEDGTRCGIAVSLEDVAGLSLRLRELLSNEGVRRRWSLLSRRIAAEASNARMIGHYETMLAPALSAR